ncbi:MAG TPA: undecaprenyl-diphosphate phosphatase [Longimicrobiales bacterium]|nr:undecaprenyl-diphosphate phosphatase [Longimicrobiales bacterium]
MSWWEAAVLGVIQGLTEFFPVSSSGHLVMGGAVLGLEIPGILFEVAVHVATLVSVLFVYRLRIWTLIRGCCGLEEESTWPYVMKLVLATIPAAIVGFTLEDWFEARFDDPVFAGTMILVTGSFVWSSRWVRADARRPFPLDWMPILVAAAISLLAGTIVPFLAVLAVEGTIMAVSRVTASTEWRQEPTWGGALLMGIAQSVAILPGISRSGSTVLTGMWRRIDPVAAAEFSFLMSIPAILGAAVLKVPDIGTEGMGVGVVPLLVGGIAAGVAGILAISLFVALLKRQNFYTFAYYCWAVGALFLLYMRQ